jgi:hypothetical protein
VADGGIVLDSGVDEVGVTEIFVEAFDLVMTEGNTASACPDFADRKFVQPEPQADMYTGSAP